MLTDVANAMAPLRLADSGVFILGDNRANSRDSRHFGCVPTNSLIATVEWWVLRRDPDGSIAWSQVGQDVEPNQTLP